MEPAQRAKIIVGKVLDELVAHVPLRWSPLDNQPYLPPWATERDVANWNMILAYRTEPGQILHEVVVQPVAGWMAILPRPRPRQDSFKGA